MTLLSLSHDSALVAVNWARAESIQHVCGVLQRGDQAQGGGHVAQVVLHAQVGSGEVLGIVHDLLRHRIVLPQPRHLLNHSQSLLSTTDRHCRGYGRVYQYIYLVNEVRHGEGERDVVHPGLQARAEVVAEALLLQQHHGARVSQQPCQPPCITAAVENE